ncbi:hypothetical protein H8959_022751 [Pygathrix nigripes]
MLYKLKMLTKPCWRLCKTSLSVHLSFASEDGVLGGVIVLRSCRCSAEPDSSQNKQTLLVEFLWSHTTESMCVGYMSAQDGKAKTHISRLPPGAVAGQSVAIEGGVCRLESPVN